jgi:predicted Zn-dependent peptidase
VLAWATLSLAVPASLAGQASAPDTTDLLVARESADPTGLPRILILDAPGAALVTLRLSVPFDPGVDATTAAPILRRLAMNRVAGTAATLGAEVETGTSASALSYTVTGALVDLDHLTFVLRQATAMPLESEGFAAARGELEAGLARIGETGEGLVEAELRGRSSPGEASISEVRERVRRFTYADLESVWRATHDPDRMTLVVVGDVATPILLAALSGLGADRMPDPPSAAIAPSPPVRDRPDILRRWHGLAWRSTPTFDPRAVVAASLAAAYLREQRDGYEAYVRLWEGRSHDVLALVGSAYGNDATALRRQLAALPTTLAQTLDEASVRDAVQRLHWNLLSQARTPWGRANLVGRFLETGATPDAARRYVDALLSLTAADIRTYLSDLAASDPIAVQEGS